MSSVLTKEGVLVVTASVGNAAAIPGLFSIPKLFKNTNSVFSLMGEGWEGELCPDQGGGPVVTAPRGHTATKPNLISISNCLWILTLYSISGVKAEKVSSALTKEGVLVVTAPRGNTAANQSYTHSIENSMNKVFL
jgi:hypothetical protein